MSTNPSGKVNGQTVEITNEGVMSVLQRRTRNMLNEHGIEEPDPQPEGWYEMHDFVGVLEDIKENALNKVGEATPNYIEWPTDVDDPADALTELDDVYDDQHRSAPGSYDAEVTGDATVRVTADTPYPCAFDRGLVKGSAEAFGAGRAQIETVGGECREDGGSTCVYEVTW
jgi:hypothetical protein